MELQYLVSDRKSLVNNTPFANLWPYMHDLYHGSKKRFACCSAASLHFKILQAQY